MMPISCLECRRRKIKCNKMVPCNQCTVKDRKCEYPGKFRSIEVDELVVDGKSLVDDGLPTAPSTTKGTHDDQRYSMNHSASLKRKKLANGSSLSVNGPTGNGESSEGVHSRINGELVGELNRENEALKLKIRDLKLKNKRQRTKLRRYLSGQDDLDEADALDYAESANSGTQKGDSDVSVEYNSIYYGPNSTRYMISSAMTKDEVSQLDDFIKVRRQINQKRDLPILVHPKTNSAKARATAKAANMEVITGLIKKFFHLKVHFMNYLSPGPLLDLFDRYDDIQEWQQEDEHRLLLAIMVMIVSLRCIPRDDPLIRKHNISYEHNKDSLYKQYKNLKRGIQIETTTSLRAYVLECEELFYCEEIEKSWRLLFHLVSSAYSLGLHVYDESIVQALKLEEHEKSGDVIKKNEKTSLWLVINFISAALCSVLGRPNPVTFNFQPLLKNYEIRLNYKIALADLVKKSTNILIDSYKIPIDLDTVLDIDESYVNEVLIYEKILIDTRIMRNMKSRDVTKPSFITLPVIDKHGHHPGRPVKGSDGTTYATATVGVKLRKTNSLSQMNLAKLLSECPLDIRFTILRPCLLQHEEEPFCLIREDADTLSDLIMLYGNRAKFHQHFMFKYSKSLESCLDSILKVLEHSQELLELLIRKLHCPCFQQIYPLFYVFLYQTFVVMYTLMHLGYAKLAPYYNEIGIIRQRLIKLFDTVQVDHWRKNVVRIIQYINDMCDNFFQAYLEKEQQIPCTTTLPPLNFNGKAGIVHLGTFQAQERTKETELSLQRAAPPETPRVGEGLFRIPGSASPKRGEPLFPDLQMKNVPDEVRIKLESYQSRSPSTDQAGAPPTTNVGHQLPASIQQTNGEVQAPVPVQFYMHTGANSLSQTSLANYNMDYYDASQQLFPPQNQHLKARAADSVATATPDSQPQLNNIDDVTTPVQIDPLLGFDLSDPFFVQNPYNFNYAPPTEPADPSDSNVNSISSASILRDNSNDEV